VAGPAALVVAKVHKICDRLDDRRPTRVVAKDASDVLRLVRTTTAADMIAALHELSRHPVAGPATRHAIEGFDRLFRRPSSDGVRLAVLALATDVPAAIVETQLTERARRLCDGLT
jgi:hypothetical protein